MTGASRFPTRIIVPLAALLALAAGAGLYAARDAAPLPPAPDNKPGRPPEDEDPDAKPVSHHVISDEPDDAGPKAVPAPRAVDLKAAARDAKHFAVQSLFNDLAVPHDSVKFNEFMPAQRNRAVNIVPIPEYVGDRLDSISWPLEVTPFAETSWTPGDPIKAPRNGVDHITPYEKLALDAVDAFLNQHYEKSADPKKLLSRYDQDVAAAQALTTVLLRLQSARQTGGRTGAAWDAVEDQLKQRLLGVLLEELDDRVQARQWDQAFALTTAAGDDLPHAGGPDADRRPAGRPGPGDVGVGGREAAGRSAAAAAPAGGPVPQQRRHPARQRRAAEAGPGALRRGQAGDRPGSERDQLLNDAHEAWPGLPGLRSFVIQQSNRRPTLRVGVRELPGRMSPGLASTDADLRAVELMFESLVKLGADGAGGARWEPGLAQGRPGTDAARPAVPACRPTPAGPTVSA